jgi:hypothetical protein
MELLAHVAAADNSAPLSARHVGMHHIVVDPEIFAGLEVCSIA